MSTALYIHVPFCASRCAYCDFFSTTQDAEARRAYVDALCAELRGRREECCGDVMSVYFGGGTPSQLSEAELERILGVIFEEYALAPDAEITLEANPDDVSRPWAEAVCRMGFNRVSLGVQTFDDDLLRLVRRRHTSRQAVEAIELLGGTLGLNVSADLIYALPGQTLEAWRADLLQMLRLPISHLSAYCLSFEEGTALWKWRAEGRVSEAEDELVRSMYMLLIQSVREAGFEHYEISNFCRVGRHSRHNSAYWNGTPYIGCGPAAASYDGRRLRRTNSPDLVAYIAAAGAPPHTDERLSDANLYDEAVMLRLRTSAGLPLSLLAASDADYLLAAAAPHLRAGRLVREGDVLRLTPAGILVSNDVLSDLMRAE